MGGDGVGVGGAKWGVGGGKMGCGGAGAAAPHPFWAGKAPWARIAPVATCSLLRMGAWGGPALNAAGGGSRSCISFPPFPPPSKARPHHPPHLMRMPGGRASSSLAFLMFLSASSEDLGAERGEMCLVPPPPAASSTHTLLPFPPPALNSRQEILHFFHRDVPGGVQRVLHAAVGRVDGAGREGGLVLLGGPWGATGRGWRCPAPKY